MHWGYDVLLTGSPDPVRNTTGVLVKVMLGSPAREANCKNFRPRPMKGVKVFAASN